MKITDQTTSYLYRDQYIKYLFFIKITDEKLSYVRTGLTINRQYNKVRI